MRSRRPPAERGAPSEALPVIDRPHRAGARQRGLLRSVREAELLGQPHRRRGQRLGDVGRTGRRRRAHRERRRHRARRGAGTHPSVRQRALARSRRQGARHRAAAADALLGEIRRVRHREGQAHVRRALPRREPQARRGESTRARPAYVRRARRESHRHEAAGTARGGFAQGPARRDRHPAADLGIARRSAVLRRRPHRPRDRQPDHQGGDGAVRALGVLRSEAARSCRRSRSRRGARRSRPTRRSASTRSARHSPTAPRSSSTSADAPIPRPIARRFGMPAWKPRSVARR